MKGRAKQRKMAAHIGFGWYWPGPERSRRRRYITISEANLRLLEQMIADAEGD